MRKLLFVVFVAIFISGCASKNYKMINSGNIGYIMPSGKNNKICHTYVGLTVFNNEFNEYVTKESFSQVYKNAVEVAIKSQGNQASQMAELSQQQIEKLFTRSEWDHSLTATDEGVAFIKRASSHNVDYILVPWAYKDQSECPSYFRNFINGRDQSIFGINYQVHIISTDEDNYQERTFVGTGGAFLAPFDIEVDYKLSDQEVENLQNNIEKIISTDVRKLLGKK